MTKLKLLLEASFPAQTAQLSAIRQVLHDTFAAQNCPKTLADRWVLAINEACMNIIQHAYGADNSGEIIVAIWRDESEWTFRLTDFAEPVDKTKVRARNLEDVRPGGLGVHFIQEVMDEMEFLDTDNVVDKKPMGNILQMKSRLVHKKESGT